MDSGKLNKRVTFTLKTMTVDDYGTLSVDATTSKTVWANVVTSSIARIFTQNKEFQGTVYIITVRYDAIEIENIVNYSINYKGNSLKIITFENWNEDSKWLKITAHEG